LKAGEGGRFILDLSFPAPEDTVEATEPSEPNANTFSQRISYGSDSLVPIYFVQLNFERKR
jgi:hypothetical protein